MTRIRNLKELKSIRKHLRKRQTNQEQVLWSKLRSRQLQGLKFYRQYSVDNYILDFYCPERKLGIELDGGQHNEPKIAQEDLERTRKLSEFGVIVLRYWNNDVTNNLEGVLESIALKCQSNSPQPSLYPKRGKRMFYVQHNQVVTGAGQRVKSKLEKRK